MTLEIEELHIEDNIQEEAFAQLRIMVNDLQFSLRSVSSDLNETFREEADGIRANVDDIAELLTALTQGHDETKESLAELSSKLPEMKADLAQDVSNLESDLAKMKNNVEKLHKRRLELESLGFVNIAGHMYLFSAQDRTFNQAVQFCASKGNSFLPEFTNDNQYNQVRKL